MRTRTTPTSRPSAPTRDSRLSSLDSDEPAVDPSSSRVGGGCVSSGTDRGRVSRPMVTNLEAQELVHRIESPGISREDQNVSAGFERLVVVDDRGSETLQRAHPGWHLAVDPEWHAE